MTSRVIKILWYSRHPILKSQTDALTKLLQKGKGDVTLNIVEWYDPKATANDILQKFKEGVFDDLFIMCSQHMIKRCIELGVCPLYAELVKQPIDGGELVIRGVDYDVTELTRAVDVVVVRQPATLGLPRKGVDARRSSEIKRPSKCDGSFTMPRLLGKSA